MQGALLPAVAHGVFRIMERAAVQGGWWWRQRVVAWWVVERQREALGAVVIPGRRSARGTMAFAALWLLQVKHRRLPLAKQDRRPAVPRHVWSNLDGGI